MRAAKFATVRNESCKYGKSFKYEKYKTCELGF